MRSLRKQSYWDTTKYLSWPWSLNSPVVRTPTPTGTPESCSFPARPGETEDELYTRCLHYRDVRGLKIWGAARWEEMLRVKARSVARHRKKQTGPINGVTLSCLPNRAPAWVAQWYELQPDGKRKKRKKQYSFGTEKAQYGTSKQAMAAAIEKRLEKEKRWYTVSGKNDDRKVSKL